MGGTVVRRGQRLARSAQVQAQEVGEGERRGAADRLRTEHKEVGSGPGAGSAQAGAGGSPASTGSGESLRISCDWTAVLFRLSDSTVPLITTIFLIAIALSVTLS